MPIDDSNYEKTSTDSLIQTAQGANTDDDRWKIIRVLHRRGTRDVFEAARQLCAQDIIQSKILGADLLGQIGNPEHPFLIESLNILIPMLQQESDVKLLNSIAVALGHLGDERAVTPLLQHVEHPDEDVRYGVAYGLLGHAQPAAIQAMIKLSTDADEDVRNWATFGLATQIDTDTAEIREALYQRVTDTHDETRGEALLGLARRKDPRVVKPLESELASDAVGRLAVEAAQECADPKLLPALQQLQGWWDVDKELLAETIANCSSTKHN